MGGFVVEAKIELDEGCDPAAVGAAVTVELCGHWEHDGPCRWPHNSAIDAGCRPARFRTVFVADELEAGGVGERIIAGALGAGGAWRLVSSASRPIGEQERRLAERLAGGRRLIASGGGRGPA